MCDLNLLLINYAETANRMLDELVEMVKLSENLSWNIATGIFTMSIHKIEEGKISWQASRKLVYNHLSYSQTAILSGSVMMSRCSTLSIKTPSARFKKVVCKWFSQGICPHNQDHLDTTVHYYS